MPQRECPCGTPTRKTYCPSCGRHKDPAKAPSLPEDLSQLNVLQRAAAVEYLATLPTSQLRLRQKLCEELSASARRRNLSRMTLHNLDTRLTLLQDAVDLLNFTEET